MLPEQVWSELLGQGTVRRYAAGSVMLRQGDPGTHLLALTAGLAKVVRRERDGATSLLAFRGPGDLLGEVSVFDGKSRVADVFALGPCTAVVLDARQFLRFVETRGLVMELMQGALARLRESDLHRTELLTLPLVVRLARTLVRLYELATPAAGGALAGLRLVGVTQEELAQSIGVTRNAVGGGLQQLRAAGVLETARREVVIKDLRVLRHWAAGTERADGL